MGLFLGGQPRPPSLLRSASEMVLKFIELRIMLVETTHLTQVE